MPRIWRPGLCVAAIGVFALATLARVGAIRPAAAEPCQERPAPVIAPDVPLDVCVPDGLTTLAVEAFDDYSWRAFVALVWPAATGRRGEAAASRDIGSTGPRVFETFKTLPEIFHRDGSAPEPLFDKYGGNPCGVAAAHGDVIIGSDSGIDDIGQAGVGELDGPLVAQNGRYVRTLTFFNDVQFHHIVDNKFYLRSALPAVPNPRPAQPVMDFPTGSIAVKTAWIDVAGFPEALVKRIYTRPALVKDIGGGGCAKKTMGLIGMHIAQKTPSRPQWIWSSFEQKDLVPPKWPDWPGAYVLNDNTGAPMPQTNPLSLAALVPEPARPFNVVRHPNAPVLTRTELTSFAYQRALTGTPWQYYRLVVTQWPRREGNQASPIPAELDGSIANTFPGEGAFSAFANVTMETFDQHAVRLGCMSCHNRARMAADFMWTVLDHAYPARLGPRR